MSHEAGTENPYTRGIAEFVSGLRYETIPPGAIENQAHQPQRRQSAKDTQGKSFFSALSLLRVPLRGVLKRIFAPLRRQLLRALTLLAAVFATPALPADAARPVRIIVPFLGGSLADDMARIVANMLDKTARQPFVVENRPGDDGHFGAELVAKAPFDGYTLLLAPIVDYAAAVSLHATLHYDLLADFTPVTLIANAPHVVVAHPSLPAKTVAAVIALAKSRPGQIRWGSHGIISLSQLELEMFRDLSDIRITSVQFNSSSATLSELLAGNADLLFDSIAATLPHIKSGRLRAVAVAGSRRSPTLRELPTVAEAGVKGFEADYWYGILAPEGVDQSVITKLNDDFAKAINARDVGERLMFFGIEARSSTSAELAQIMRGEVAKWAKVIKDAGIKSR